MTVFPKVFPIHQDFDVVDQETYLSFFVDVLELGFSQILFVQDLQSSFLFVQFFLRDLVPRDRLTDYLKELVVQ